MKTFKLPRRVFIALSSIAAAVPATLIAQDSPKLQPVIDSTVRIRVPGSDREGTGWVIAAADPVKRAGAGVIVTALSVVEDASRISVREPTGTVEYQATVLERDADRNLIFLEVKDLKAKPITIGAAPGIGGPVWGLGYNRDADDSEQNMAANASAQSGTLSREIRGPISSEARASVNQLEVNASMLPGFEGGPLVNHCAQLVGMDLKSAGTVGPRSEMRFRARVALTNALKADEIVKAAIKAGIEPEMAAQPCGDGSVADKAGATGQSGEAATGNQIDAPVALATSSPPSTNFFTSTPFLILIGLVGLIAAAFGIYTLTRRDDPVVDVPIDPALATAPPPPQSRTPTTSIGGTALIRETQTVSAEKTLRLNGRGPSGEPIDFTFGSTELQARPVMLGVGPNVDVRFPDNRVEHRVSRRHAQIGYDGRNFTIFDNKSLNHTFVGNRQLDGDETARLVNGDTIRFADIVVNVSID